MFWCKINLILLSFQVSVPSIARSVLFRQSVLREELGESSGFILVCFFFPL